MSKVMGFVRWGLAAVLACGGFAMVSSPSAMAQGSWSGFYAGVHAGYGWGRFDQRTDLVPGFLSTPAQIALVEAGASGKSNGDGFLGGGQIGYNFQSGALVMGVEADLSLADLSRQVSGNFAPNLPAANTFAHSFSTDWLGTVRGRLGFATGNLMLYATGGLAFANLESSSTMNYVGGSAGTGSKSSTVTGWTIGGGAEYALNRNWTIKGEYLFVDLGEVSYSTPGVTGLGYTLSGSDHKTDFTAHLARIGMNYRF